MLLHVVTRHQLTCPSFLQHVGSQLSLSAASQSDIASCTQSLTHGGVPELLLGLSYNATTGRMSVELIRGSLFRNLAVSRPPGVYAACATALMFRVRKEPACHRCSSPSSPRHLRPTDSAELGGSGDRSVQDVSAPRPTQPSLQGDICLPGGAVPAVRCHAAGLH